MSGPSTFEFDGRTVTLRYDKNLSRPGEARGAQDDEPTIVLREWDERVLLHELLHVALEKRLREYHDGPEFDSLDPTFADPRELIIQELEDALWEHGWRLQSLADVEWRAEMHEEADRADRLEAMCDRLAEQNVDDAERWSAALTETKAERDQARADYATLAEAVEGLARRYRVRAGESDRPGGYADGLNDAVIDLRALATGRDELDCDDRRRQLAAATSALRAAADEMPTAVMEDWTARAWLRDRADAMRAEHGRS